jgi:hypothetical protein
VHEADQPDLLGDLAVADRLTGEDLAEVDLSAVEAGATAASDRDRQIMDVDPERWLEVMLNHFFLARSALLVRLMSWPCARLYVCMSLNLPCASRTA